MATQKVCYFTAGQKPTTNEAAQIAALQALAQAPFEVVVRDGSQTPDFAEPETFDLVASYDGSALPAIYDEAGDLETDVLSVPDTGVLVVQDGDTLAITGGTVTFAVTAGVIGGTFA